MSEEPLEPLDPELAALLEAERTAIAPNAALQRAWTRIAHSESSGTRSGLLGPRAWPFVATAFVAGIVIGATGYALLGPPSPARVVVLDGPPVQAAASALASDSAASPAPPAPSPPILPEHRTASPSAVPSTAPLTFSAERALLDSARASLSAGDPARALSRLDEHARHFPKPRLAEEREALAIQALVLLQRYDDARERAAHFKASYPNSLFLPAIDTSLSSIP